MTDLHTFHIEFTDRQKAAMIAAQIVARSYFISTAFIIGGFYRDAAVGGEFKDIDVFMPSAHDGSYDMQYDISNAGKEYQNGFEVNMIWLSGDFGLEDAIRRCDFGICQIGAPLSNPFEPLTTEAFRKDIYSHTFTQMRETSEERIGRMQNRLPGWRHIPYTE